MADAQTQDDPPYRLAGPDAMDSWRKDSDQTQPDIGSLVGGSTISDLVKVQKQKTAADIAITSEADKRLALDQARVDKAFAAEGVSAAEQLKPWDADKEHKRFEEDPIQGFGSVGGLFAMVASAFTKAPMENAINGMAGAINSIKAGDEAAYERAHQSWQENTKLALERFKTQHELYSDALGLMDHDQAAATAKLHNAAIRFGDSKTLILAEHGLFKELFELQASRASAAEQMQKASDNITESTFKKAAVNAVKLNPPNTGNPTQDKMMLAAQIHQIYAGGKEVGTPVQEAVGQYVQTHDMKDPKFVDGLQEIYEKFTPKAVNIEGYRSWLATYVNTHDGKYPSAEEDAKMQQQFGLAGTRAGAGAGAGGSQSSQARKTRAIQEIQDKHAADGKPISMAEAEREYNKTVQIPSAHDVHQDTAQYQKAERMESAMDEMDELLLKHKLITGLGGTVTRPFEVVGNILGSNETDRKQFQRIATELKEWGQSVVNDRSGRPLSSEAKDAAVIFAGLNPGDTSANTMRAIAELRPVIKKIKEQLKARSEGGGPGSGEASTTTEEPKTDWLSAYPEKK
jgi:hypothetical protein